MAGVKEVVVVVVVVVVMQMQVRAWAPCLRATTPVTTPPMGVEILIPAPVIAKDAWSGAAATRSLALSSRLTAAAGGLNRSSTHNHLRHLNKGLLQLHRQLQAPKMVGPQSLGAQAPTPNPMELA